MPTYLGSITEAKYIPDELTGPILNEEWIGSKGPDGKRAYGITLFATSADEARQAFKNMGNLIGPVGEFFDPFDTLKKPSTWLGEGTPAQAMHAMVFLAWAAVKNGKLTVDELLGDEGYLHTMAHFCRVFYAPDGTYENTLNAAAHVNGFKNPEAFYQYVREFESRVGFAEDWE